MRQHAPVCKFATPVYYHIRIRNEYTQIYCRPIRTGTGRKMSSVRATGVSVVTLADTYREIPFTWFISAAPRVLKMY